MTYSIKHPPICPVDIKHAAYKELEQKFYVTPDWEGFEKNVWLPIERHIPQLGNDGLEASQKPGDQKYTEVRNAIPAICKKICQGYFSLFAELRFFRKADDYFLCPTNVLKTDPDGKYREALKACIKKSQKNYNTAATMHTHESYWDLRELGLTHSKAYDIMENIIRDSVNHYRVSVGQGGERGNFFMVPTCALDENKAPRQAYVIESIDEITEQPEKTYIMGVQASNRRVLPISPQISEKLDNLVRGELKIEPTRNISPVIYY